MCFGTSSSYASNVLLDRTNSRVRIGAPQANPNPQYPLDVQGGDINSWGVYRIGGTEVLNSTTLGGGVTASSLTSLGTLTTYTIAGTSTLPTIVSTNTRVSGDLSGNRIRTTGNITCGGSITSTGNITCGGTLYVDSLQVHPPSGNRLVLTNIASSYSLSGNNNCRTCSIVGYNLQSTGSASIPSFYFYGNTNEASYSYEGMSNGNFGAGNYAWGSTIPLWNTPWTTTGNLNFWLDIVQISPTLFLVKGASYRSDSTTTAYFCHIFGSVSNATVQNIQSIVLTGNTMSVTRLTYSFST